jgi:hypothetical protein
MKGSVLWDITVSNLLKVKLRLKKDFASVFMVDKESIMMQVESRAAFCFTLVSHLAYFSTLKMEPIFSSETSLDFY